MLKLFLWFRYLHSRKIVFLSIAAVTLSVALMIVVDSLFTGVIGKLEENSVADVGDIFIWLRGRPVPQYNILLDKLEEIDGIETAAPFIFGGGLLHLESGDVREVIVQGIDPNRESNFTDWKKILFRQKGSEGKLSFKTPDYKDADGAWVGVGVVAEPNEKTDEYDLEQIQEWIGKTITLITTGLVRVKSGELMDISGEKSILWEKKRKRRMVKLRISDIAFTNTYTGDRKLYLPFEQWHKIQYGEDESGCLRNIKIKLKTETDIESVKAKITAVWEDFVDRQLGWSEQETPNLIIRMGDEFNSGYFAELRKQMRVLLLIFGVICSVVVLLVFCIFYMIVETKQKDIAVIKSFGASKRSVMVIFAGFGCCVGIVGSILGIFLGFVITSNINIIENWIRIILGLRLWRSSAYGLNQIPHQVDWLAIGWIAPAAVAGCFIGALIPAIVAAKAKPVEILRYE